MKSICFVGESLTFMVFFLSYSIASLRWLADRQSLQLVCKTKIKRELTNPKIFKEREKIGIPCTEFEREFFRERKIREEEETICHANTKIRRFNDHRTKGRFKKYTKDKIYSLLFPYLCFVRIEENKRRKGYTSS